MSARFSVVSVELAVRLAPRSDLNEFVLWHFGRAESSINRLVRVYVPIGCARSHYPSSQRVLTK
jgi:hypothetical protein